MTVAGGLVSLVLGLGFGIPGAIGLRHFAERGEVWTFMGFPAYGGGPFERFGIETGVLLLGAFVTVCLAEVVIGVLLLMDHPAGSWLAIGLLPIELVFWIGFALPLGPPLGLLRAGLVAWSLLAA
jgi:hypothetical protein